MRRLAAAFGVATGITLALASAASAANVTLKQVSSDPFTNNPAVDGVTVYHQTEEEPDTFSFGSTIVSAFQVGRFFNGGASDIGWATSTNGGQSYRHGFLPGLTFQVDPSSPFERVSDASVAFDAKHHEWLISSVPLLPNLVVPTVFVSRSADGLNWSKPVTIPPPSGKVDLDKNWTVCDNNAASPFFGNCYTEFDNFASDDLELMSTSTDGGATWGTPQSPQNSPHGLGGQPLVQPNGTVIVPFESIHGTISAFTSTDGGASWNAAVIIAHIDFHTVAGHLRTSPLPSAEIDGGGTVYVAWEDCSFEPKCSANDIVFSTSSDGVNWSGLSRVPADPIGSGVDHFIPGMGVDRSTSGPGAHLGLTYYFYPNAACTVSTCQLDAGFISSADGGAHWSGKVQLAGPMTLTWLALSSQGFMVGDYIATAFNSGAAFTVIASASSGTAPENLNEAMFASPGLGFSSGGTAADQAADSGVSNIADQTLPLNR